MRELIDAVFARHLANEYLDTHTDAACINVPATELVMTTDGFTVQPLEFPGGDIGSLAVHGTINDLAVLGATPMYLSLNVFAEEGLQISQLERIVVSLAAAASQAGVRVVTGDTKVLPRGEGGGLYLATTGIGTRNPGVELSLARVCDGDAILVSGPVGDHGIAVMLAREEFGLRGTLQSDAASVVELAQSVLALPGLRFMRDPTRGGVATVAHEISAQTGFSLRLLESSIPVRDQVGSVCEMLGFDPYYLACEGRVIMVVEATEAARALEIWRELPSGVDAAIIGRVDGVGRHVVLETELGGERILEELEDEPLPRIC